MRFAVATSLLCLSMLFGGCGESERRYFPTDAGARWRYQVWGKSQHGDEPEKSLPGLTHTVLMLPERALHERSVFPRQTESEEHRTTTFLTSDSDGIYELGVQRDDGPAVILDPPSCVLGFPLRVGGTCMVAHPQTTGGLQFTIKGTQQIEATADTVSVPAGTFRDCVRVRTKASGSVISGSSGGPATLEAEIIEWFAPRVGLVKQINWEVIDPISLGWGTRTMELVEGPR